ncbi:MAG TPA: hypothetical protein GXX75_00585 [Clostridiales bacterium]|nr:hypothetical protein [Clostridiales bacterium]
MTRYIAVATLFLLVILVLSRAFQLKKMGIKAIRFGEMDKKDFLIPPPNWIILIYIFTGTWLVNRQILLEEQSLKKIYGEKYMEYCNKVRRFL